MTAKNPMWSAVTTSHPPVFTYQPFCSLSLGNDVDASKFITWLVNSSGQDCMPSRCWQANAEAPKRGSRIAISDPYFSFWEIASKEAGLWSIYGGRCAVGDDVTINASHDAVQFAVGGAQRDPWFSLFWWEDPPQIQLSRGRATLSTGQAVSPGDQPSILDFEKLVLSSPPNVLVSRMLPVQLDGEGGERASIFLPLSSQSLAALQRRILSDLERVPGSGVSWAAPAGRRPPHPTIVLRRGQGPSEALSAKNCLTRTNEAQYVALRTDSVERIEESCSYVTLTRPRPRTVHRATIRIYAAKTGSLVAQQTFAGPSRCPDSIPISQTVIHGGLPNEQDIDAWLYMQ